MQILRKNLVLKFKTTDDAELELTILKPAEGIEGADIKTAMTTIIETGAYGSTSQAAAIVGAQYDIRQVETVNLG